MATPRLSFSTPPYVTARAKRGNDAVGVRARLNTEGLKASGMGGALVCGGGREGIRHATRTGAAARTTHRAEVVVDRKGTARAATPRTIAAHTKARASSRQVPRLEVPNK